MRYRVLCPGAKVERDGVEFVLPKKPYLTTDDPAIIQLLSTSASVVETTDDDRDLDTGTDNEAERRVTEALKGLAAQFGVESVTGIFAKFEQLQGDLAAQQKAGHEASAKIQDMETELAAAKAELATRAQDPNGEPGEASPETAGDADPKAAKKPNEKAK